jgi:hypothetical protein
MGNELIQTLVIGVLITRQKGLQIGRVHNRSWQQILLLLHLSVKIIKRLDCNIQLVVQVDDFPNMQKIIVNDLINDNENTHAVKGDVNIVVIFLLKSHIKSTHFTIIGKIVVLQCLMDSIN